MSSRVETGRGLVYTAVFHTITGGALTQEVRASGLTTLAALAGENAGYPGYTVEQSSLGRGYAVTHRSEIQAIRH